MADNQTIKIEYTIDSVVLKTSYLPRRCIVSGKMLFFSTAYRYNLSFGSKMGTKTRSRVWMSTSEYLLLQLKGSSQ